MSSNMFVLFVVYSGHFFSAFSSQSSTTQRRSQLQHGYCIGVSRRSAYVYIWGGNCPSSGGSCPGGSCPGGRCPGGSCPGGGGMSVPPANQCHLVMGVRPLFEDGARYQLYLNPTFRLYISARARQW